MKPTCVIRGFAYYAGFLDPAAQREILHDLQGVARSAPPFSPDTPGGRPMSVKMTSAGRYGWYSDRTGYRYVTQHPAGVDWPPIPPSILSIWEDVAMDEATPDCCLVNFYGDGAKMGMHQDRDEADFSHPVVSLSLGDDALFRIGAPTREGKTESLWLKSGDVMVMGGDARLTYHGIDRIKFGSSRLLPKAGRLNVTLRVVR